MSLKAGRFGVNRKSVDRKGNVQAPVAEIPEATPGNIGGVEFNSTDASKVLAVNSDGTGLEWVDKPQGGGGAGVPLSNYTEVIGIGWNNHVMAGGGNLHGIVFDFGEDFSSMPFKKSRLAVKAYWECETELGYNDRVLAVFTNEFPAAGVANVGDDVSWSLLPGTSGSFWGLPISDGWGNTGRYLLLRPASGYKADSTFRFTSAEAVVFRT